MEYMPDKERILTQIENEVVSVAKTHQDSDISRQKFPPPKKTKELGANSKANL